MTTLLTPGGFDGEIPEPPFHDLSPAQRVEYERLWRLTEAKLWEPMDATFVAELVWLRAWTDAKLEGEEPVDITTLDRIEYLADGLCLTATSKLDVDIYVVDDPFTD